MTKKAELKRGDEVLAVYRDAQNKEDVAIGYFWSRRGPGFLVYALSPHRLLAPACRVGVVVRANHRFYRILQKNKDLLLRAGLPLHALVQYNEDKLLHVAAHAAQHPTGDVPLQLEQPLPSGSTKGLFCPYCFTFNTHEEAGTYQVLNPVCKVCGTPTEGRA